MCDDEKFNEDELTILYNISNTNPFKVLDYLEESRCYAESNIEMRERLIQEETRHLWKDEKVCVASSKRYIKQMKRENRIFQARADMLLHLIQKIRSGEFTEEEEDVDKRRIEEGEKLYQDMIELYSR
jgi:hypothetical protein